MKREFLKIILLLLAVAPMWWTIVAFAEDAAKEEVAMEPMKPLEVWRHHLNEKLLQVEDRRIQILEIVPSNIVLEDRLREMPVQIDLSEVRDRGVSQLKLHYKDKMGRLVRLISLPVKLYIERPVPVARNDLRQGQVVTPADVEVVWRESTHLPETPTRVEELIGTQVKMNISKGEIIESARLEAKTLVRRGERVRISVKGEGISIQGFGVAQEAGVRGQTIRLLNSDSKKEIYGVVTTAQSVEVRL